MKKKKKGKKKLSSKSKILFLIGFLLFDTLLIFGIYRINEELSRDRLDIEFSEMLKQDISIGEYNTKNVCGGKYKKVEKAIKSYFNDYSNNLKAISKIINSDKFVNILSDKSLKDNKENLEEVINYSISTKKELDDLFLECNAMVKEDYLVSYITNLYDNEEVTEIFMSFMTSDDAEVFFNKLNEDMNQKQLEIDTVLDNARDCFYFLVINDKKWYIEDGKIQFASSKLMNQYNAYIESMKIKKS